MRNSRKKNSWNL